MKGFRVQRGDLWGHPNLDWNVGRWTFDDDGMGNEKNAEMKWNGADGVDGVDDADGADGEVKQKWGSGDRVKREGGC